MSWHTAASEPVWILPVATSIGTLTLAAIMIGTIWYFYNARKQLGERDKNPIFHAKPIFGMKRKKILRPLVSV
jgi:hypothetical protein